MRVLYPSARHDRFVHSLGTFHLGCLAFDALEKNAKSRGISFAQEQWDCWQHTFQIACLLHDCGHAPFSHTFEDFYDLRKAPGERLVDKLAKAANTNDTVNLPETPHELVSAILILENFREAIREVNSSIDPVLVARMITGWDYSTKTSDALKFESCLIKLLNGHAIDVDKLDYIIRDTWASGCDNTAIDTQRLLNAVSIGGFDGGQVLAFEKGALSVIQSVVTARNYLYRWIYSHHKVTYDAWLLGEAVKALSDEFGYGTGDEAKDQFLQDLFSIDVLIRPVAIGGREFSIISDGDIMHYLKKWAAKHPGSEADEWLSRRHSRKAMWKSYAEYHHLFRRIASENTEDNKKFRGKFETLLKSFEKEKSMDLGLKCLDAYPKQIAIDSASVYVNMPQGTVSYSTIESGLGGTVVAIPKFFYAYLKKEFEPQFPDIIAFIKDRS